MREIKFRAWDKKHKEMYYLDNNYTRKTPIVEMHIVIDEMGGQVYTRKYGEDAYVDLHSRHDIELLEFTGLKDKNGKEIYKGDILQIETTTKPFDDVEENPKRIDFALVKEDKKNTGFNLKVYHKGIYKRIANIGYYGPNGVVIGNAYENPELLEVK